MTVFGLTSEAGKKLNGGHGIVLSDKPFVDNDDTRHPIIIISLKNEAGEDTVQDKEIKNKIKVQNLKIVEDPRNNEFLWQTTKGPVFFFVPVKRHSLVLSCRSS